MAKGKATSSRQARLDLEAAPAAQDTPEPPQTPSHAVAELGTGPEGAWKMLAGGKKKVPLSAAEWRQELARLFARAPAP